MWNNLATGQNGINKKPTRFGFYYVKKKSFPLSDSGKVLSFFFWFFTEAFQEQHDAFHVFVCTCSWLCAQVWKSGCVHMCVYVETRGWCHFSSTLRKRLWESVSPKTRNSLTISICQLAAGVIIPSLLNLAMKWKAGITVPNYACGRWDWNWI